MNALSKEPRHGPCSRTSIEITMALNGNQDTLACSSLLSHLQICICPHYMNHSLSLIPHHMFAHRNSAHLSGNTRWQVDLVFFFQPVTNCPEYACGSPCPTQSTMVLDRNMIPYYSSGKFTLDLYVVSSEIFFSILVFYKFCVSCLFVVVHYWSSCLPWPYCRSYLCQWLGVLISLMPIISKFYIFIVFQI